MIEFVIALGAGFLLDWIFGDPRALPHPVVYIGKLIAFLEKKIRKLIPDTPGDEIGGGTVLVVLVLVVSTGLPSGDPPSGGACPPVSAAGPGVLHVLSASGGQILRAGEHEGVRAA